MQTPTWQFYLSTKESWFAMLEACNNATSSIDIEQYLFELDVLGRKFIEVCIKKAHEGIKIRILCDAVGSNKLYMSRIPLILERAGIEIVFYNPFIIGTPGHYTTWFFRDHRKLLIVDNRIGFTGGICFREEMKTWRDTHVKIEGYPVQQMVQAFSNMWKRAKKVKAQHKINIKKVEQNEFAFITQSPLPRRRYAFYALLKKIKKAKHHIYLTTPYLVPHHRLVRALKRASYRGVDVHILVPDKSDHPIVDIASRTYFRELLIAGINIWKYKTETKIPTVIHAKTSVIDDTWCTVGSLNLDYLSLLYNFEAVLVSTNHYFVQEVSSQFKNDLTHSEQITLKEWDKRSYLQQFLELLVLPIRRFL